MRNATVSRTLLLVLLPLLFILAGAVRAAEAELTVVAPEYWCPFSCAAGSAE